MLTPADTCYTRPTNVLELMTLPADTPIVIQPMETMGGVVISPILGCPQCALSRVRAEIENPGDLRFINDRLAVFLGGTVPIYSNGCTYCGRILRDIKPKRPYDND